VENSTWFKWLKWGTLLASVALVVAGVVLDRRGAFDRPPPQSYQGTVLAAGPPPAVIHLVPPPSETASTVAEASTPTASAAPSSTPTPTGQSLVVTTETGLGVALRSDCDDAARTGQGWPEGQQTLLVEPGSDRCDGWSLVEADGLQSWVRNEYLSP
jgi:hypothetical protein